MLLGLAALRWGAWMWMAAALLVARQNLDRPAIALTLVVLALVVTVAHTALVRARPAELLRPGPIVAEVVVGVALVLGDGWARQAGRVFTTSQSLGSVWPLVGVLSAGVGFGPLAGGLAGASMGVARVGAVVLNQAGSLDQGRVLSLANSLVFYALAGSVAGWVAALLRRAEVEVSTAHAREEVARTLHDGVLQTLALVERRTADPALARLAREQEHELREYLFGAQRVGADGSAAADGNGDVGIALRAAAARFERAYAGRAQVVVADDLPVLGRSEVEALVGAAGEAMTNAGKHGEASRVTVYVEPTEEDGVFCSVKDDGTGFDPQTVAEGEGLRRSIRGRMSEVGGRAEVSSAFGRGTEVRLSLPPAAP